MEIRAGTGGDEASIFAGDLFRMYSSYAGTKGWKIEIVDISFNGNLIKFQALATDAEAGTSSVSPAKYLGESEGEINLFEDTSDY